MIRSIQLIGYTVNTAIFIYQKGGFYETSEHRYECRNRFPKASDDVNPESRLCERGGMRD